MNEHPLNVTDFPVEVSEKEGAYFLRVVDLHLIETNTNLNAGYDAIIARRAELYEAYKKAGVLDELVSRKGPASPASPADDGLKVFAIKSGLVALAGVIVVCAAAFTFSYTIKETTRKTALKMGRSAIKQIEKGLADAAQAELTPERKEKIRILVADAAPHLRPFINELKPLFVDFCPPSVQ